MRDHDTGSGKAASPHATSRLARPQSQSYICAMKHSPGDALKRGWTTGACATAATKAAYEALLTGTFPDPVSITPARAWPTAAPVPPWSRMPVTIPTSRTAP
jgi:hypothetical protein